MILKSIQAQNILKYRTLRLTNLPRRGQIAVAGANEAGKTAIGETICLGLFGRTFSLGPDELDRVIRWGEFGGSVTVTFLLWVPVAPSLSVTVSSTKYVPPAAYLWLGVAPLPVSPSPKSHE